jgi:hypothetical protein
MELKLSPNPSNEHNTEASQAYLMTESQPATVTYSFF